jgi:hypothetical protein
MRFAGGLRLEITSEEHAPHSCDELPLGQEHIVLAPEETLIEN